LWSGDILAKIMITRVVINAEFVIEPYLHWFSQEIQQQISSYHNYKDRLIAFTSHLLQKYYLLLITNCEKDKLVLAYSDYHKPYILYPKQIANNFNFNISHTYNQVILAVYAGADDYLIGVDIEKIDNTINVNELSPTVFSDTECKLINGLTNNFFKLWTKKEALIKAIGFGFTNDFYQNTALNLQNFESTNNYCIISCQLNDYFLSVCLYKKSKLGCITA
jgi:4'-phosphopantetheinyl transferase